MESMPMHPHSGISTVTVITQGHLLFDDPEQGSGTIDYGGVEWMRASGGVWHGKEMSVGPTPANHITGFQLWVALPPHLENGPAVQRHEDCRTCYDCGGQVQRCTKSRSFSRGIQLSLGYFDSGRNVDLHASGGSLGCLFWQFPKVPSNTATAKKFQRENWLYLNRARNHYSLLDWNSRKR